MKKTIVNGIRVGIVAAFALSASFTLTSCENDQMQVQPVEQQMSLADRLSKDAAFHEAVNAYHALAAPMISKINSLSGVQRQRYLSEIEALSNTNDKAVHAAKRGFSSVEAFVNASEKFSKAESVLFRKYPELAKMSSTERAGLYSPKKADANGRMEDRITICVCWNGDCLCVSITYESAE